MVQIQKTTNNGHVRLVLEVNETATNIANNSSTLSWSLKIENHKQYAYDYDKESLAEVEIAGQKVHSAYHSFDTRRGPNQLASGTLTVPHENDGSKTITIWARMNTIAIFGDISWFSGSMILSKIPRASAISNVGGGNTLGSQVTIAIDRKVSGFTHQVWYRVFGSDWVDLGKGHGTSVSFTPATNYASRLPNATSGALDVCVRTYNGGTQIGDDVYTYNYTVHIPNTAEFQPKITSFGQAEKNSRVGSVLPAGQYLCNLSELEVEFAASAGSGASIQNYQITVDGNIVSDRRGRFRLPSAGQRTVTLTAKDSGGRSASKSFSVTVLNYENPKIVTFHPERAGNGTNKGVMASTILTVKNVIVNNRNINLYQITVEKSLRGENRWERVYYSQNESVEQFNKRLSMGDGYELAKSYDLRLKLIDKFTEVTTIYSLSTSTALMVLGKERIGFGAFPELRDTVSFFYKAWFQKAVEILGHLTVAGDHHVKGKVNAEKGFFVRGVELTNEGVVSYHDAALQDGWQHYTWEERLQYGKSRNGTIYLRGAVKNGQAGYGKIFFTLPAGYRPSRNMFFPVFGKGDYTMGAVIVLKSGAVSIRKIHGNDWVCFDGITFTI